MKCPACQSEKAVQGRLFNVFSGWQPLYFRPNGLKLFVLSGADVKIDAGFSACTGCGLVWSSLCAAELKNIVQKKGSKSLKEKSIEMDPTLTILDELKEFRDSKVVAMFEIHEDRGWFHNLFKPRERWIEVQWLDDNFMQIRFLSRSPSSDIPLEWKPAGESRWLVLTKELRSLSEWIIREWLRIRVSENMKLTMWND